MNIETRKVVNSNNKRRLTDYIITEVKDNYAMIVNKDSDQYGLLDIEQEKNILPIQYDNIEFINDKLVKATLKDRQFIIDLTKDFIFPIKYNSIKVLKNLIVGYLKDTIDIYNMAGKILKSYNDVLDIKETDCDLYIARCKDGQFIIDNNGHSICNELYDKIQVLNNEAALVWEFDQKYRVQKYLLNLNTKTKTKIKCRSIHNFGDKALLKCTNFSDSLINNDGKRIKYLGHNSYIVTNDYGIMALVGNSEVDFINTDGKVVNRINAIDVKKNSDGSFTVYGNYTINLVGKDGKTLPIKASKNIETTEYGSIITRSVSGRVSKYSYDNIGTRIFLSMNNNEVKEIYPGYYLVAKKGLLDKNGYLIEKAIPYNCDVYNTNNYLVLYHRETKQVFIMNKQDNNVIRFNANNLFVLNNDQIIVENYLYDINNLSIIDQINVYDEDNIIYSKNIEGVEKLDFYKKVIEQEIFDAIKVSQSIADKKKQQVDFQHQSNIKTLFDNIEKIASKVKKKVKE